MENKPIKTNTIGHTERIQEGIHLLDSRGILIGIALADGSLDYAVTEDKQKADAHESRRKEKYD